jgi:hypothetical protein
LNDWNDRQTEMAQEDEKTQEGGQAFAHSFFNQFKYKRQTQNRAEMTHKKWYPFE